MKITQTQIQEANKEQLKDHATRYQFLQAQLEKLGLNAATILEKLMQFQVAIPSWALGAGGTRFGRFSIGGEPGNLPQKIEDIGLLHALTRSAGAVSLHIPWDVPEDTQAIKALAAAHDIAFDAVNSNTFQDQKGQTVSYKHGSLAASDPSARALAIAHNKRVIDIGESLGSKSLTVWLSDGSSFPGQLNFRKALQRTMESLKEIYAYMPADWKLYIEYKPYEPNFYSTVIQDWGTSHMLANACGERAYCLVDLGHHLPNTNIEQIVATLMWQGKLGGFHFNDSKYGDDDLTVGSIKPYQLFLIFNELVYGMENNLANNPDLAWMIDASHNVKDPLEDLIQSLEAIRLAYAQALIVDHAQLEAARESNDVTSAQELLQAAFRTDLRPLLAEARLRSGAAIDPIGLFRHFDVRNQLIEERGFENIASGL
ncbi:MAG: TIM barrel protein [Bacteroidia bacterium]